MFSILRLLDCRMKSGKVTQPIKVVHYLIYMYMYKNSSVLTYNTKTILPVNTGKTFVCSTN